MKKFRISSFLAIYSSETSLTWTQFGYSYCCFSLALSPFSALDTSCSSHASLHVIIRFEIHIPTLSQHSLAMPTNSHLTRKSLTKKKSKSLPNTKITCKKLKGKNTERSIFLKDERCISSHPYQHQRHYKCPKPFATGTRKDECWSSTTGAAELVLILGKLHTEILYVY